MLLDGTLQDNLQAAIRSAERLRGHPVYRDTLEYRRELLTHARDRMRNAPPERRPDIDDLVAQLEAALAERS